MALEPKSWNIELALSFGVTRKLSYPDLENGVVWDDDQKDLYFDLNCNDDQGDLLYLDLDLLSTMMIKRISSTSIWICFLQQ